MFYGMLVDESANRIEEISQTLNKDYPMAEKKPDEPTNLEPDDVAVVYNEKDGYRILLLDSERTDELPEPAVILVAVGMRLTDDKEFYHDMVKWFTDRHGPL